MILGFDVSTSCVGISVLESDGSLFLLDHVDLKDLDLFSSADRFRKKIEDLSKELSLKTKIGFIFIEEPKRGFQKGKTSTNTILNLNRFNGICSYIIYNTFGIVPIYINESTARKKCGLKLLPTKKCEIPQKQQAFEQMCQKDPFINYEWTLKRTGKVKDYHMDQMDAYIVSRAGFLMKNK